MKKVQEMYQYVMEKNHTLSKTNYFLIHLAQLVQKRSEGQTSSWDIGWTTRTPRKVFILRKRIVFCHLGPQLDCNSFRTRAIPSIRAKNMFVSPSICPLLPTLTHLKVEIMCPSIFPSPLFLTHSPLACILHVIILENIFTFCKKKFNNQINLTQQNTF